MIGGGKSLPFFVFYLHNPFSLYICAAIPRESGVDRESAFFALFLVGELAHSLTKRGILKGGCFRCDVCVISSTKHTQWSIPVIHYFSFQGVQALPTEIRISLGGSALFAS